ncbi:MULTISPECIES: SitA3 family lipoprotein polymorphic toxin [Myxococcus]|nr:MULTISPECIES: SitA3 family lipoprotein polymorphic toxin [Myxococcus]QZZ49645.1 hypothetical protein MyxoNM_10550 [Myxococcus xanthus]UYI16611.1 SitA3 family lipoprotein polymorphic toxin [Myxococcus xanthus]UYI24077.1 SitA3 family lipoprotein polymorphic toxin [Myxococcus xanthus]SDY01637.1 hypothetical protein SAMN05444383_116203 [Myxococcus xanthus]
MAAESLGKWVSLWGTLLLASGCATLTPLSGHGVALGQGARVSHAGTLSSSAGNTYLVASSAAASTDEDEEARLRRRRPGRASMGTAVIAASPADMAVLAVETGMLEVDAFEKLLVLAGLGDTDVLPPRVNPFTPEEADRLLALLVETPVTLGNFPPRMAVGHLLREVLEGGEVSRAELLRRVARFQGVAVLRPDGYLAWVRNGRTQQRVAEVAWKDGAFRAHGFELGRFYGSQGGIFRLLDAQFRELNEGAYAEVYDDADVVSRTLDGAEDAFVELYHALGHLFTYPTDSILALRHLPAGVAALIASSPEYWERFRYMTAGEQMKAVAKLSTTLLIAGGSANGVTRTLTSAMGGAEAMVPILSLSAQGALAIQRVAVPVGKMATVVGAGVGTIVVLSQAAGSGGGPKLKGSLTGRKTTPGPHDKDPANIKSIQRENESAEILAENGYHVEQNPAPKPNGKEPDYRINGEYADCYAPNGRRVRNMWDYVRESKVESGQADRIVMNLEDTPVPVAEVREQFLKYPIQGLKEVLGIKDGKVSLIYP